MIPHTLGWLPYMSVWIVYANEFLTSLNDLKKEDEDLYDSIPTWVPYAVFGTFVFFTLFTLPQWRYQSVRHFDHMPSAALTPGCLDQVFEPRLLLEDRILVRILVACQQAFPWPFALPECAAFQFVRRGHERHAG